MTRKAQASVFPLIVWEEAKNGSDRATLDNCSIKLHFAPFLSPVQTPKPFVTSLVETLRSHLTRSYCVLWHYSY